MTVIARHKEIEKLVEFQLIERAIVVFWCKPAGKVNLWIYYDDNRDELSSSCNIFLLDF